MARGHRVEQVPELPLVVENLNAPNTKSLLSTLTSFGAGPDLTKVRKSRHIRSGAGKYRNSRYVTGKGPLIIYGNETEAVKRQARNLPGVDTCHVNRLNILQLAPGGHLGRFLIFTKDAFKALNTIFGTYRYNSLEKSGYRLNRNVMTCADLARIINSDQVQSKLRDIKTSVRVHDKTKKNPLNNKAMMLKLNPFAKKKAEILAKAEKERQAAKAKALKAKKSKDQRKAKAKRTATYNGLQDGLKASFKAAEDIIAEEEKAGNYVPGETDEEEESD